MDIPTTTPVEQNRFMVRLAVQEIGAWFSVGCEVCNQILASGDPKILGVGLQDVLRRASTEHMHKTT
jgi:hypothetical protein